MRWYYKVGPTSTYPDGAITVSSETNTTMVVGSDGKLVFPPATVPSTFGCQNEALTYQACAIDEDLGYGPVW